MRLKDALNFEGMTVESYECDVMRRLYEATAFCDACGVGAGVRDYHCEDEARLAAQLRVAWQCFCDRVKVPEPVSIAVHEDVAMQCQEARIRMSDGAVHVITLSHQDRLEAPPTSGRPGGTVALSEATRAQAVAALREIGNSLNAINGLGRRVIMVPRESIEAFDGGELEPGSAVMLKNVDMRAQATVDAWVNDEPTRCASCHGSGKLELFTSVEDCADCGGTGWS